MYCKNCGMELKNNVKFCSGCGSKIDGASVDSKLSVQMGREIPFEEKPQYKEAMSYKKKANGTLMGMFICVIVLFIFINLIINCTGFWGGFLKILYMIPACGAGGGIIGCLVGYFQAKKLSDKFMAMDDSEWNMYLIEQKQKKKELGQAVLTGFVKGFINNL